MKSGLTAQGASAARIMCLLLAGMQPPVHIPRVTFLSEQPNINDAA